MRTSIWFRNEEKKPDESGYYLTYRGWGMGGKDDNDSDNSYLYYHTKTKQWYEYESEVRAMHPRTCIVYYWTDADPAGWTDEDPPSISIRAVKTNPALEIAWGKVEEAIRNYELIKTLSGEVDRDD